MSTSAIERLLASSAGERNIFLGNTISDYLRRMPPALAAARASLDLARLLLAPDYARDPDLPPGAWVHHATAALELAEAYLSDATRPLLDKRLASHPEYPIYRAAMANCILMYQGRSEDVFGLPAYEPGPVTREAVAAMLERLADRLTMRGRKPPARERERAQLLRLWRRTAGLYDLLGPWDEATQAMYTLAHSAVYEALL